LKPNWAVLKGGRWPGGQSRRAGGQPSFLHHHQSSAAWPPLWWGPTPFTAAPMPRWTSARAQVGATLQLRPAAQRLNNQHFTGKDCCARSCGPATSAIRSSVARTNRRPSAGLDSGLPGRLRPNSVGAIDKLSTKTPLGAGLPHRWRPAVWPGRHARPFGPRLPLTTVLVSPSTGHRWPTTKTSGAGARLWWQSKRLQCQRQLRGGQRQPRQIPVEVDRTNAPPATAPFRSGYARAWGRRPILFLPITGPASTCALSPEPFARSPEVDHPPPVAPTRSAGGRHDGVWLTLMQPAQPPGWIRSISAGWGSTTTSYDSDQSGWCVDHSRRWMVGLQWSDAF